MEFKQYVNMTGFKCILVHYKLCHYVLCKLCYIGRFIEVLGHHVNSLLSSKHMSEESVFTCIQRNSVNNKICCYNKVCFATYVNTDKLV